MRLEIKVIANSDKDEVIEGEVLTVRVKVPAKENKANVAVTKILKKYFSGDVRIVKGLTSRRKVIEIKK